jgi:hypothetical protein
MVAGDLLRLAWEADHDGRSKLRDSLLTMAVTESEPGDDWAERCRIKLLQDRPDHFLGQFATVAEALDDPRVVSARERLRKKFPEPKILGLLLRANARRGPYLGRSESLEAMLEDLVGFAPAEAENVRLDAPQPSRGPLIREKSARPKVLSLNFPTLDRSGSSSQRFQEDAPPEPPTEEFDRSADQEFLIYYSTVFLAIAFLLASVKQAHHALDQ